MKSHLVLSLKVRPTGSTRYLYTLLSTKKRCRGDSWERVCILNFGVDIVKLIALEYSTFHIRLTLGIRLTCVLEVVASRKEGTQAFKMYILV